MTSPPTVSLITVLRPYYLMRQSTHVTMLVCATGERPLEATTACINKNSRNKMRHHSSALSGQKRALVAGKGSRRGRSVRGTIRWDP